MSEVYDVAVVGAGPAGLWAAMALAEAGKTVILLEAVKRLHDTRNVSNGFMGGSAKSDVKLFLEPGFGGHIVDIKTIEHFISMLQNHSSSKIKILQPTMSTKLLQELLSYGVDVDEPQVVLLSADKLMAVENSIQSFLEFNTKFKPNCQLNCVNKVKKRFVLETTSGTLEASKCVLALGRGGAHWFLNSGSDIKLRTHEDYFDMGVRLEFPHQAIKMYTDKSPVFRLRWGDYRTTSVSIKGTVEMENVFDIKTSNARSVNGKTTHYSSIGLLKRFNNKCAQSKVLNLAQIANILADGQLIRETLNKFLDGRSVLSPLEEFHSLRDGVEKISQIFPGIKNKCHLYFPEARLNAARFEVSKYMESSTKGMYVVGDMSGHTGSFVQAACSGLLAAKHIINNS